MIRWFRRLITLGAIGGAATAVTRLVTSKRSKGSVASGEWPPMSQQASATDSTGASAAVGFVELPAEAAPSAPETGTTWVAPVDGGCPEGYPVKGNASSRIFHVPGGRSYDRTIPERCYATAQDAIADGYRAAKA